MKDVLKSVMDGMGITPEGLAEQSEVQLNSFLADIAKIELEKDKSLSSVFLIIKKTFKNQKPNLLLYGLRHDENCSIEILKDLDFEKDFILKMIDSKTVGALKMVSGMGMDMNQHYQKIYSGVNLFLQSQSMKTDKEACIMSMVGKDKLKSYRCSIDKSKNNVFRFINNVKISLVDVVKYGEDEK